MNREELVENNQFSKKKLFNLENMYSELRRLQSPVIQFRWWLHIVAFWIYFYLFIHVVEVILTPFEAILESYFDSTLFVLILLAACLISYIFLYNFIAKTLNSSKKLKSENRIKELIVKIREDELELNTTIIPKDYQSAWYAQEIEKLFLNHRADTIKEAINLVEVDNKHRQSMQNMETPKYRAQFVEAEVLLFHALGWFNLLKR